MGMIMSVWMKSSKCWHFFFFVSISLAWTSTPCLAQRLSPGEQRQIDQLIEQSMVFSKMFSGFALYDPEEGRMVYQRNADRFFTPASNTKIFTFYTALKVLGDSLPALHYAIRGDSLVFWGAGNPTFLHPDFPPDASILQFLRSRKERLFFCPSNFQDDRFGPGWAWDDYRDYYQPERSPLPIYGNVVQFSRSPGGSPNAEPALFNTLLSHDPNLPNDEVRFVRNESNNQFTYNNLARSTRGYNELVPFQCSPSWVASLLADTLGKAVAVLEDANHLAKDVRTLYTRCNDTLYQKLMQESDNFIAEQLLLMCSDKLTGSLRAENAIAYARNRLFRGAPDELVWVDGSGLSRYNLFTPRSIIKALQQLYTDVPQDRLFKLMASGGVNGTIKGSYAGKEGPFVYAKTGTLRNVHCLSGFICTQSGKMLIFSFMNNGFLGGPAPVKEEMGKVLRFIWEKY